jgi:hypothetical protein
MFRLLPPKAVSNATMQKNNNKDAKKVQSRVEFRRNHMVNTSYARLPFSKIDTKLYCNWEKQNDGFGRNMIYFRGVFSHIVKFLNFAGV